MILDYLSGPNVLTRICNHDETGELEKEDSRMEAEARGVKMLCCWLDDGGRGHEPRNVSSL